jgi:hypothetical protein
VDGTRFWNINRAETLVTEGYIEVFQERGSVTRVKSLRVSPSRQRVDYSGDSQKLKGL